MAAYWIFNNGAKAITNNGANIISEPSPAPMPKTLENIITVRTLIDDPLGAAYAGVTYTPETPDVTTMAEGAIITVGDSRYWQVVNGAYKEIKPLFNDAAVSTAGDNAYKMARILIARLLSRINPQDYITSFSTGGQSTSWASFSDYRQHFVDLQAALDRIYAPQAVSR